MSGANREMAGRRFGRLLVVCEDGRTDGGAVCWRCQCDCGATVRADGRNLRKGTTSSCGCLAREKSADRVRARLTGHPNVNRVDMVGSRFGRWVVLNEPPTELGGHLYWTCRCDCGTTAVVKGARLRAGTSSSCGCFRRERMHEIGKITRGERNGMWKGEDASYTAKHLRVSALRGKPTVCDECGQNDPSARYEWASISGRYDDVTDYRRMCVPCHRQFDGTTPPQARKRV